MSHDDSSWSEKLGKLHGEPSARELIREGVKDVVQNVLSLEPDSVQYIHIFSFSTIHIPAFYST